MTMFVYGMCMCMTMFVYCMTMFVFYMTIFLYNITVFVYSMKMFVFVYDNVCLLIGFGLVPQ